MPQDTSGPVGAAKAIAAAKAALGEANKKFPSPVVHSSAAKASYGLATEARKKAPVLGPTGDTSGQELKQAEANANELKEAAKPQP